MATEVVDVLTWGAHLSMEGGLLRVKAQGALLKTYPIKPLRTLILSRSATLSTDVLRALGEAGVVVYICGHHHKPVAVAQPLLGQVFQTRRHLAQLENTRRLAPQAWAKWIQGKVINQGHLLKFFTGVDKGLIDRAQTITPSNASAEESRAAAIYWQALFDKDFTRDRDEMGANAFLNYASIVLESQFVRALCGAGLMTWLGVFHAQRADHWCLAHDLMEPLRPLADLAAHLAWQKRGEPHEDGLNPLDKQAILNLLLGRWRVGNEWRKSWDLAHRAASEWGKCLERGAWGPNSDTLMTPRVNFALSLTDLLDRDITAPTPKELSIEEAEEDPSGWT